jgi:Xaa-Pro aminopeptidase
MIKALTTEFQERRQKLIDRLKDEHVTDHGAVILFGGLEHDHLRFRQESSFYYFTGIEEPGSVLWIDFSGHTTLFIPNHGDERAKWLLTSLSTTEKSAEESGVEAVEYLGQKCAGYTFHPFFKAEEHENLLKRIQQAIEKKQMLFTLNPKGANGYVEQRFILERLNSFFPTFVKNCIDISADVARLRRKKSQYEIEQLFKAVEITNLAHEAAAQAIEPGKMEYEVQAAIEYIFTQAGARRPAFPSIIGSGKHATVLHYNQNNGRLHNNDLVVVDIGAEYNYYCADISRTYPVSGKFSSRQKEVYEKVLDAQEYVAALAQPGYWIFNKTQPDKSLHHLAVDYLKEHGYDNYFLHGIGHFLGLDVHDVGDRNEPLEEGDIITIEPGIYIPKERIGVRIEDNYWIVKDGAVCLSEHLPKMPDEIEEMVSLDWASQPQDEESLTDDIEYEA